MPFYSPWRSRAMTSKTQSNIQVTLQPLLLFCSVFDVAPIKEENNTRLGNTFFITSVFLDFLYIKRFALCLVGIEVWACSSAFERYRVIVKLTTNVRRVRCRHQSCTSPTGSTLYEIKSPNQYRFFWTIGCLQTLSTSQTQIKQNWKTFSCSVCSLPFSIHRLLIQLHSTAVGLRANVISAQIDQFHIHGRQTVSRLKLTCDRKGDTYLYSVRHGHSTLLIINRLWLVCLRFKNDMAWAFAWDYEWIEKYIACLTVYTVRSSATHTHVTYDSETKLWTRTPVRRYGGIYLQKGRNYIQW
jgi:hypothetical protein